MEDSDKTCRVCRSGEEPGSPLYKPCKCSGSISWIHQDCLESWLSVSRTQKCELCKHPFKWDKVYASQAPKRLPATVIVRHILRTILKATQYVLRSIFVAFIWLAFLPYSILWVWRGLFHLAKGWGVSWTAAIQEVEWSKIGLAGLFMPHESYNKTATSLAAAKAAASKAGETVGNEDSAVVTLSRMINGTIVSTSMKPKVAALEDALVDLFKAWRRPEDQIVHKAAQNVTAATKASITGRLLSWLPRSSLLDRAYVAMVRSLKTKWTQHKGLVYSMAEDAFSGQIIVCCVIIAFIAAFLLREWIMANQPHVHAAQEVAPPGGAVQALQPVDEAQRNQVLRDALDRIQAAREAHAGEPFNGEDPQHAWMGDLRRRLEQENQREHQGDQQQAVLGPNMLFGGSEGSNGDDEGLPFGQRAATPQPQPDSLTNNEEGSSEGPTRRRAWSSGRDYANTHREGTPYGSLPVYQEHDGSDSLQGAHEEVHDDLESGSTSPLTPLSPSPPSSPQLRRRISSNNYGVESASEGELEDDPLPPPMLGPAPAPNAPRRGGHAHDIGNDSDTEDEDDALFGAPGGGPAGNAGALDDPILFDGDDNPDDLFFEADLQGILEAIGINGPILALLQNVALVSLLISCLLVCAVWVPLMFGKTIAATNAQKIVLLPINFVRLFTDPLADRLIHFTAKQKEVVQSPSAKTRLLGFVSKLGLTSKTKETTRQHLFGQISSHVIALKGVITASIAKTVSGVQNQWYRMAVGDTNLDRTLCIALGYFVIIGGAGVYLNYTQNRPAREAGAAIRNHIKHNFVMVKAAMFFFIEIVIFPAMCGLLLNLSTLPLIPEATFFTRISYYYKSPVSAIFLTWLAGTNFMFSFAQVISIVRKCIRKGVLYFIRDPSDPEANPLREILETPAINQAKKITRSLMVYGAIILTCFGFFPWMSRLVPLGLFPLRWNMTRPLSTVPWDLIYLLAVLPFTLSRARPKRAIRNLVRQWCKITSHQLRLSSFMLGQRRADEEGTHIRRTWKAWLLLKKAPVPTLFDNDHDHLDNDGDGKTDEMMSSNAEVVFRKDGGFARTVAVDNVKIVPKKMFVRVHRDGTPITSEGAEAIQAQLRGPTTNNDSNGNSTGNGNDESKFTIVYIPPHFKSRILLFIYLLWLTASVAIFFSVCTPLIVGRVLLDLVFKEPLHDTYSLIVGIHALVFLKASYSFLARQILTYSRYKRSLSTYSLGASPAHVILSVLSKQALQISILAINGGIILPLLVGIAAHLYVLLPFQMMGRASTSQMMELSLSLDWCYGVTIIHLACQVSFLMRENWLSRLLREVKTQGILRSLPILNKTIFRMNKILALSIGMPILVTYSHRSSMYLIWRYFLNGHKYKEGTPPPKDYEQQGYVFRIALLSVSITTLIILLNEPVKKLTKKWLENVWESEFVIKRKLRNIDSPPSDNTTTTTTNTGNTDSIDGGEGDLQVVRQGDVDMVD